MPSRLSVQWAKFRVTTVGLCALSILFVLVYLLTGGRSVFERKTDLYLYLPDAVGIEKASPVRVNGITVGKVKSVGLTGLTNPDRIVRVVMLIEVDHLRMIPSDSTAQISDDTLIGDKYVDITSGKSARHVGPEETLLYHPPNDLMKSLDLTQFRKQLDLIDATLTDIEQGRGMVGELVQGEALHDDLVKRIGEVESGLRAVGKTKTKLGEMLYTDRLYNDIRKPVAALTEAMARLQSGQGEAGRLLKDTAAYDEVLEQAASLRRTVAELRAGKGPAGELLTSDAAWVGWKKQVATAIAQVDQLSENPALRTSEMYDNLNGLAKEMRALAQDVRKDPRKYLRIKVF